MVSEIVIVVSVAFRFSSVLPQADTDLNVHRFVGTKSFDLQYTIVPTTIS